MFFQELGWSGFILKLYFYKNGKVNRIITTDESVKNLSINLWYLWLSNYIKKES